MSTAFHLLGLGLRRSRKSTLKVIFRSLTWNRACAVAVLTILGNFLPPTIHSVWKTPQKSHFTSWFLTAIISKTYLRNYFQEKNIFQHFWPKLIFRKIDFFESRMKNQSTGNVYLMQWHINLDFAFAALENFRNVKTWAEEDAQALFSKSSEKKKTKKKWPSLTVASDLKSIFFLDFCCCCFTKFFSWRATWQMRGHCRKVPYVGKNGRGGRSGSGRRFSLQQGCRIHYR